MEKYIRVSFSNGEKWDIPARIVAEDRATYYSESGGFQKNSPQWQEEYQNSLDDDYDLEDWLNNNMNWSDVSEYAHLVDGESEFNYEDEFTNAEKEIVIEY